MSQSAVVARATKRPVLRALSLWVALAACVPATACRSRPVTIRAGLLLDGRGNQAPDVEITVARGRIVSVTPWHGDSVTYDLSRYTVLPGLIDAHVHLNGFFNRKGHLAGADDGETTGEHDAERAAAALATLRAGFTTVASMGAEAEKPLRDAINKGKLAGPRILTSLAQILDTTLTPDSLRRVVRDHAAEGADFIKVFASGPLATGGRPTMSAAQLAAVCDEARRRHLRSVVHAHDDGSLRLAVAAGCTEIEHGVYASDSTLALLAAHGVWFDPQCELVIDNYLDNWARFEGRGFYDSSAVAVFERVRPFLVASLRAALATPGLKVLYGTDATAGAHGRNAEDLICRVRKGGDAPMDALVAATSRNAEALGLGNQIGTIAPGYRADIIALDGNPLTEIEVVRRVAFVMKGGVVYSGLEHQ